MIFKTAFKNEHGKYLVKILGLDPKDKEGTWANTTEAVYNWAKKTYKDGDEVDVEYSVKNGEYNVTRINKPGGAKETKKEGESKETAEKKCADCGIVLKDAKYDKCYNCNKKNPSKSTAISGEYQKPKTPAESERIKRLSLMESASRAVIVLQGHIDNADTLAQMIITIYNKLKAEVEKDEPKI